MYHSALTPGYISVCHLGFFCCLLFSCLRTLQIAVMLGYCVFYIPPMMDANISQSERKARQYEELLAQQRRIQAQMAMIDPETRREVDEHQRLEQDITMFTAGHLSEPTTPPEYYSSVNRVHSARLSTASLASPPGFPTRPSRSGSQLASPQATFTRPVTSHVHSTSIPSRSVPASRRGSDEDEEDNTYSFADINRRAAKYVPCLYSSSSAIVTIPNRILTPHCHLISIAGFNTSGQLRFRSLTIR
jgi:hypothetical protein